MFFTLDTTNDRLWLRRLHPAVVGDAGMDAGDDAEVDGAVDVAEMSVAGALEVETGIFAPELEPISGPPLPSEGTTMNISF